MVTAGSPKIVRTIKQKEASPIEDSDNIKINPLKLKTLRNVISFSIAFNFMTPFFSRYVLCMCDFSLSGRVLRAILIELILSRFPRKTPSIWPSLFHTSHLLLKQILNTSREVTILGPLSILVLRLDFRRRLKVFGFRQ